MVEFMKTNVPEETVFWSANSKENRGEKLTGIPDSVDSALPMSAGTFGKRGKIKSGVKR